MALTPIGAAALISREAIKTKAYRDSVGFWTIGIGHTSMAGEPPVTSGLTITRAEALEIFARDLVKYERAVDQGVTRPIADHQRDAFVSICFNIGQGTANPKKGQKPGFLGSTFLKLFNEGDMAGCAAAIMRYRIPAEIISRRTAERDQFLTPYSVALPKGRSTDPAPIRVDGTAAAPAPRRNNPAPAPAAPKPRTDRMNVQPGKWAEELLPKFEIEAIQKRFVELGWQIVGVPNGVWGDRTTAAAKGLQELAQRTDPTIIADGHYGPQTKALLADTTGAYKAPISDTRRNTTANDLAKVGTPGVVVGRKIKLASIVGALGTVFAAAYAAWQAPVELPTGSGIALAFLPPPVAAVVRAVGPYLIPFVMSLYATYKGDGMVSTSLERFHQGIDNTGLPPQPDEDSSPAGWFGKVFGARSNAREQAGS